MKTPVIVRSLLILSLSIGSAALLFSLLSTMVGPPLTDSAAAPTALPAKTEPVKSVWQKFTTIRGNFSVLLPGTPQATTKAGVSGFEVSRPQDAVIYGISYMDFPADPKGRPGGIEEVFVGAQAGFEENHHVLVTSTPIQLQGKPGRAMKFTRSDGLTTHCRVYIIDQRLYLVMARTIREKDLAKSIEGFLNSFQITQPTTASSNPQ
jgi:hypothetical protein